MVKLSIPKCLGRLRLIREAVSSKCQRSLDMTDAEKKKLIMNGPRDGIDPIEIVLYL